MRSGPIITRSFASSKSRMVIFLRPLRAASSAASFTMFARSAPVKPGVPRARISGLTSSASGLLRLCTLRIPSRPRTSGKSTTIWRSKRPGRRSAGIEHVGPVGGREQDDALVRLEAVHLHQELVQGLLALVVPAAQAGAAVAADRVDLVDEDDAGGVALALLEEIADAAVVEQDRLLAAEEGLAIAAAEIVDVPVVRLAHDATDDRTLGVQAAVSLPGRGRLGERVAVAAEQDRPGPPFGQGTVFQDAAAGDAQLAHPAGEPVHGAQPGELPDEPPTGRGGDEPAAPAHVAVPEGIAAQVRLEVRPGQVPQERRHVLLVAARPAVAGEEASEGRMVIGDAQRVIRRRLEVRAHAEDPLHRLLHVAVQLRLVLAEDELQAPVLAAFRRVEAEEAQEIRRDGDRVRQDLIRRPGLQSARMVATPLPVADRHLGDADGAGDRALGQNPAHGHGVGVVRLLLQRVLPQGQGQLGGLGKRVRADRMGRARLRVPLAADRVGQADEDVAGLQVARGHRADAVARADEQAVVSGGPDHAAQEVDLADLPHAMAVDAARGGPGAAAHEGLGRAEELRLLLRVPERFEPLHGHGEALFALEVETVDELADLHELRAPVEPDEHRCVAGHGGPDPHEHLHEVASAHAEERHARLAGHRLGQERLPRAGRAEQEGALRDAPAEALELLRVAQELDDLLQLLLGLVGSGHVAEGDLDLVLVQDPRAATCRT